jgi:hypothetical protein
MRYLICISFWQLCYRIYRTPGRAVTAAATAAVLRATIVVPCEFQPTVSRLQ